MFSSFPVVGGQIWDLEYEVGGARSSQIARMDTLDIKRFHFALMPTGKFVVPDEKLDSVMGFGQHIWSHNKIDPAQRHQSGFEGFYFPKDRADMVVQNFPKGDTTTVKPSLATLKGLSEGSAYGEIVGLNFDLKYFATRKSGFIVGIPAELGAEPNWFTKVEKSTNANAIYSLFGGFVDPQILSSSEFIYIGFVD
jgi:hypothetical protein